MKSRSMMRTWMMSVGLLALGVSQAASAAKDCPTWESTLSAYETSLTKSPTKWEKFQAFFTGKKDAWAGLQVFVKKELSDENTAFVSAVLNYKLMHKSLTAAARLEWAKKINSEFIAAGAPRQVNVDTRPRENVATALTAAASSKDGPAKEVFDACYDVILLLLRTDTFARFVKVVCEEGMPLADGSFDTAYKLCLNDKGKAACTAPVKVEKAVAKPAKKK